MCNPAPVAEGGDGPDNCIELWGVGLTLSYVYYVGGFFGGIFGTLFGLLGYNLAKMFGWIDDIQIILREQLAWFTTPPTAAEQAALEEARRINNNSVSPFEN